MPSPYDDGKQKKNKIKPSEKSVSSLITATCADLAINLHPSEIEFNSQSTQKNLLADPDSQIEFITFQQAVTTHSQHDMFALFNWAFVMSCNSFYRHQSANYHSSHGRFYGWQG